MILNTGASSYLRLISQYHSSCVLLLLDQQFLRSDEKNILNIIPVISKGLIIYDLKKEIEERNTIYIYIHINKVPLGLGAEQLSNE